uniref:Uncharacterized protein n=1 Tax=Plectus sambesii TaxID=2011161 RepID=A0A914VBY9_9BILA
MLNVRQGLLLGQRLAAQRRAMHHATEALPPMRWVPLWQRFAMFFGMTAAILSYPTWVMINLNNIRPHPTQKLSDDVLEKLEKYKTFAMDKK